MKNCRKKFFLLSIASLPFLGGDLFASTTANNVSLSAPMEKAGTTVGKNDKGVRLGYCEDYKGIGYYSIPTQQLTEAHQYCAAIRLPASYLNKYVGCKIDSVEFVLGARTGLGTSDRNVEGVKRGTGLYAFVVKNLDDLLTGNILASVSTSDYSSGYNKLKFDQSVTLQKDQELYVGYYVNLSAGDYADCVAFDDPVVTKYSGERDMTYFGFDFNWNSNTKYPNGNNYFNAAIRAIASGNNIPNGDMAIYELSNGEDYYTSVSTGAKFTARVRNFGIDPITTATFNVTKDGQNIGDVQVDGLNVPNNVMSYIEIPGVKVEEEGDYNVQLKLKSANGVECTSTEYNSGEVSGFMYKKGGKLLKRTPLFEQLTSENYSSASDVDECYADWQGKTSDGTKINTVWIKHHMYYKGNDQFYLEQESTLDKLYGKTKSFVPAIVFDRTTYSGSGIKDDGPAYFVSDADQFYSMLEQAAGVPAFVTVDLSGKYNETDKTISANVSLEGEAKVMPHQTDLRLTTMLVEDGVESTTQSGVKGTYVQNGVVRAYFCNDVWGDAVDLSTYFAQKSYSIPVMDGWNLANMRIVSFVNNYNSSNKNLCVYNAAEYKLPVSSGIDSQIEAGKMLIRVVDGNINVSDGCKLFGVYDMSGRQVSSTNLPAGMYIVKAGKGTQTITHKVLVGE